MEQSSIEHKFYSFPINKDVMKLVPANTRSVLDVGCGAGHHAHYFQQKNIIVDGITISEDEVTAAKPFCRNLYVGNIENGLPAAVFNNQYDLILCSHVLEHVAYPGKFLEDVKKIMHKDSVMIVALPNLLHYHYRFQLLRGNFNYESAGTMDNTHLRFYTFRTAKKLLEDAGFTVKKAIAGGEPPLNSVLRYFPGGIKNALRNMFFGISKGFFGDQLIYVATLS